MLEKIEVRGKYYENGPQISGKNNIKNLAKQIESSIPYKQEKLNALMEMKV